MTDAKASETQSDSSKPVITGSCLCKRITWSSTTKPSFQGYCFCTSCRHASGSGFIPFMGFAASTLKIQGVENVKQYHSPSESGRVSVRNFCTNCGSLIFGGTYGEDEEHTMYAGTLDDPSKFVPSAGIFDEERPKWVVVPEGLNLIAKM